MTNGAKSKVNRRSRYGCHNCKRLKIKCDEAKPICTNCTKSSSQCDYSIKLTWGGRSGQKTQVYNNQTSLQTVTNGATNMASGGAVNFISVDFSTSKKGVKRRVHNTPISKPVKRPKDLVDKNSKFSVLSTVTVPSSLNTADIVGFSDNTAELDGMTYDNIPGLKMLSSLDDMLTNDPQSALQNLSEYADDNEISSRYDSKRSPSFTDMVPLRNHVFSSMVHRDLFSEVADWDTNSSSSSDFLIDNSIPPSLDPLPDLLYQVPKYRELFHFFINNTADCLVPFPSVYLHNPFKHILPQIAMSTPHLLSLILAYSASHRAKFLHQQNPVEMIQKLMTRTFDGLAASLQDSNEAHSDATLATATMLCSYDIVNGTDQDSWQAHLQGARNIVMARGLADEFHGGMLKLSDGSSPSNGIGGADISRSASGGPSSPDSHNSNPVTFGPQPLRVLRDIPPNKVCYFLLRILAYLDVLGSLSSSTGSSLLTTNEDISGLWSVPLSMNVGDVSYEMIEDIDVLLGMELNLIPVYSKVASLIRRRKRLEEDRSKLEISATEIEIENETIISDALMLSQLLLSYANSSELRLKDLIRRGFDETAVGLAAMSLLFTYGVILHLYRRVLLLESDSHSVKKIINILLEHLESHIPIGSPIEACLSFPIVTTACEVKDPVIREKLWSRLQGMSRFGIGHIERAAEVVKQCWGEDKTWPQVLEEAGYNIVLA